MIPPDDTESPGSPKLPRAIGSVEEMVSLVGLPLGTSGLHTISQESISTFAALVGDHQWIHVDADRAREQSPFGTTIAHGHLLLALLPGMLDETLAVGFAPTRINYGLNRTRFTAPVPSGSAVYAEFTLRAADPLPGGLKTAIEAAIFIARATRPCCVTELIHLWR